MREGATAADPLAGGGDLSEHTPLEGELVELEPVFAGQLVEVDGDEPLLDAPRDTQNWRPDPLYHGGMLAASVGVLLLAWLLSVRGETQVLVPILGQPLPEICMFRRMFGVGCPGCGLTRCFISLAHGDLSAAWGYNPAGLLFFALVAIQIPYRSLQLWRISRGLREIDLGWVAQVTLGGLAIALIGQWLLRLCGVPL